MSSSDEGEILENEQGQHDLKATTLQRIEGSGVDRRDRNRNRNSSEENDAWSRHSGSSRRSRSPQRRPRDDRAYAKYDRRGDRDRHNGSGYRDDYRRSRVSYEDLDRPSSRGSDLNYDREYRVRDRHRDRSRERNGRRDERDRYRERSRSPKTSRPNDGRRDNFVKESHHDRRDKGMREARYDDNVKSQEKRSVTFHKATDSAEQSQSNDARKEASASKIEPGSNAQSEKSQPVEMDMDWEPPEQIDEQAEIERRRQRRAEILAKSSSATPLLLHAVGAAHKTRSSTPGSSQPPTPSHLRMDDIASPASPSSNMPSPGGINVLDEKSLMNTHAALIPGDDDGPSAADYDPTADMKEDERRDELRNGQVVLHGEPHAVEAPIKQSIETGDGAADSKEASDDDDDLDMFADDFDEEKFTSKPVKTAVPIEGDDPSTDGHDKGGILEGDDKDGYYKFRVGEVLNGRYQIQATLGRGMFSSVARAKDITDNKTLVAIKLMRNNDALRKGGFTEIAILQKLNNADPDDRKHIVRFERNFDYKGHLCMTFENLNMNLREVLRKFGNNVGIKLSATKSYAYQMFVALAHMRKCTIIHADLKPDNILVTDNLASLKICDLGTAIDRSDAATAHTEITPYLVSRFYRAPEIMLGMPYDYGVDMWSIGCTLYELYTGKILFAGDSNNQMLKAIMETRGKLTQKLYKKGQLSAAHFDENGHFVSVERDKVLGKTSIRTLPMTKPTRDLRTRVMAVPGPTDDPEDRNHFVDLLEQCLALNPDKRIKPADALKHPFFTAQQSISRSRNA